MDNGQLPRELASELHEDQVDKLGAPYYGHLSRVAMAVEKANGSDQQVAAAWLHDSIEDAGISADELLSRGVRPDVVLIIEALTHREGEEPNEYYERVLACPGAALVKLADLHDNLNPDRLTRLDGETRRRLLSKYGSALVALSASEESKDDIQS